jgi:uncharacterized protein (TIGR02444 family)
LSDSKSDSIISEHFATKAGENPPLNTLVTPLYKHLDQLLDNALWQYACQVYSLPGMEVILLDLQDEHSADINLILQALWLASEGIEWTFDCIPNDYGKWVKEQVIPIRTMRRSLKIDWVEQRCFGCKDFRQEIKSLELKAEQYALAMLYQRSSILNQKAQKRTHSLTSNLINIAEHFKISSELILKLIGNIPSDFMS